MGRYTQRHGTASAAPTRLDWFAERGIRVTRIASGTEHCACISGEHEIV